MVEQWIITLIFIIAFASVLVISELFRKKYGWETEYTRKLAHILASLGSILLIAFTSSHWPILIIAGFFFLLLFIGKLFKSFNSIDGVVRKTSGSYLLPLSIYILFLVYNVDKSPILFILPLLILGISDPLAGLSGIKLNYLTRNIRIVGVTINKTVLGSRIFFTSTLFISIIVFIAFGLPLSLCIFYAIILATTTTIMEMVSFNGTDNLTVPIIAAFTLMELGF